MTRRFLGDLTVVRALATGVLLAGCAAEAGTSATSGDQADSIGDACPTKDAATKSALADVAAQAARCADEPPQTPAVDGGFEHPIESALIASQGSANHRGRDSFYAVGAEQWVLGKFAYGAVDMDLKRETVDIFVQTGCAGPWSPLGTATTTTDGEHDTVEGIDDTGGRVFFAIPAKQRLPIGHHRVRMVVRGDRTFADQFIEVLPPGTPLFVSDVDGTLTERRPDDPQVACDEESDFPALWRAFRKGSSQPFVHEGASAALTKLTELGYRPLYLTARPEWLVPHTRAFLSGAARGDGRGDLPSGIVHTTLGLTGAVNSAAQDFKMGELELLANKGFHPTIGFGNRKSDVATYTAHQVPYGLFFENLDTSDRSCSQIADLPLAGDALAKGMFRIQSYVTTTALLKALSPVCR